MVVGGAGSGALLTAAYSQMQRNTTGRLRASVVSLVESAGTISFVSGVLAAGFLVDRTGVTTAYLIAGIGTLLTAVPLFFNARD